MSDPRHRVLAELFERAVALSDTERRALVEHVRESDLELGSELAELLRNDLGATEFFGSAVGTQREQTCGLETLGLEIDLPELSRFQELEEIARGGMGVVWKVRDPTLRRVVAQKRCLVRPLADASPQTASALRRVMARFLEEAQITARLDHPGVVPVHELGVDSQGRPFFTMRLVQGGPLGRVFELARGEEEDWSITRAVGVLVRVAETVEFAHQKGVIHRDLKPANVMVGRFGEVYVVDWGLARPADADTVAPIGGDVRPERIRAVDHASLQTLDDEVLGTPSFMSPEQAAGRRDEVGPATDVYALGAILYELLAGFAPYCDQGCRPAREGVAAVLRGPPTRLQRVAPSAPAELVAICDKAMRRTTGERYASARTLAADLQAYLDHRVVRAYRTGPGVELVKWVRRHRAIAATSAAALLLVTAALVVTFVLQDRAAARDRRSAYLGNVSAAMNAIEQHEVLAARTHLERAPPELRGWEWGHLWARLDEARLTIDAHEAWTSGVAFAGEDDRLVVSASKDGSVRVFDAESGALVRELCQRPVEATALAVHPDGQLVGVAFRDRILVWDLRDGARIADLSGADSTHPMGCAVALAFHPSEPWLATGHELRGVRTWDVATGTALRELEGHESTVGCVAFGPDGRWLATGSSDRTTILWEAATGRHHLTLEGQARKVQGVAFTPDGAHLLASGTNLCVWSVPKGELVAEWKGRECRGSRSLSLHPDGERAVVSCDDGTVRVWNWRHDSMLATMHGHEREVGFVAWRGDGRQIVSAGLEGVVKLWDPAAAGALQVLEVFPAWACEVGFLSPDELWFVDYSPTSTLYAWAQESGELRRLYAVPHVHAAAWCPQRGILAAGHSDNTVNLADVDGAEAPRRLPVPVNRARALTFSNGGDLLAVSGNQMPLAVVDLETSRTLFEKRGELCATRAVAFGPADRWVAAARASGAIEVTDARTGRTIASLTGHTAPVAALALHPSGAMLASASEDATVRLWDTRDWKAIGVLEGHTAAVRSLAFHPDGTRLASGGNDTTIRLWDPADRREVAVLRRHVWSVLDLEFSPDGRRLASACRDGTIGVWDTAASGTSR